MLVIEGVLREEKARLDDMEKAYREKIADLPKGSIQCRMLGAKRYAYLKYRDESGRVIQKYVGIVDSEPVKELERQIVMRRNHEVALKKIMAERKLIGKVIK